MRERADHMGVKCREEEKRGERRGGRPGESAQGKGRSDEKRTMCMKKSYRGEVSAERCRKHSPGLICSLYIQDRSDRWLEISGFFCSMTYDVHDPICCNPGFR